MKLLRFGEAGKEKPGLLVNDEILDASSFGEDYGEKFFETDGLQRLSKWVSREYFQASEGKSGSSDRCPLYQAVKDYLRWTELHQACTGIQYAVAKRTNSFL